MNSVKARLIQVLFESAIPLLGFYFWEWNLYFILLFYMMDMVADEVMLALKGRDIIKVGRAQWSSSFYLFVISTLTMLLLFGAIHFMLFWINNEIDFKSEFVRFWTYKELGMEQGYLLLPLVVFAAYQKYKLEYKRPRAYLKVILPSMFLNQLTSYIFIFLLGALLLACDALFQPGEQFFVLTIVIAIALYKLPFLPQPNRK